jgi:hypothetical protein
VYLIQPSIVLSWVLSLLCIDVLQKRFLVRALLSKRVSSVLIHENEKWKAKLWFGISGMFALTMVYIMFPSVHKNLVVNIHWLKYSS